MNALKYLEMLRDKAVPEMRRVAGRVPKYFMQDGAPAHYARIVRDFLNEIWPNCWIGRGSSFFEWAPRSPDLNPLDFFFWGYAKQEVYKPPRPANIDSLIDRIHEVCRMVETKACLENVYNNFMDRLNLCLFVEGQHFEQMAVP